MMARMAILTVLLMALGTGAIGAQEVSGNVNVVWNDTEDMIYEFSAREDAAGQVIGQWRADNLVNDALILGDVDCLCVDGNDAWLGITITQIEKFGSVEWGFVPGGQIIWRIEDNGDGSEGAGPDAVWGVPTIKLIKDLFDPTPPVTSCQDKPDMTVIAPDAPLDILRKEVKSGDIRIRQEAPATAVEAGTWGSVKSASRP